MPLKKNPKDSLVTNDIDEQAIVEPDVPVITWSNRRRMSWLALYAMIGTMAIYSLIITFWIEAEGTEKLKTLETLFTYFLGFMVSIVLGYFGSTTLPYIGKGVFGGNGKQ